MTEVPDAFRSATYNQRLNVSKYLSETFGHDFNECMAYSETISTGDIEVPVPRNPSAPHSSKKTSTREKSSTGKKPSTRKTSLTRKQPSVFRYIAQEGYRVRKKKSPLVDI